MATINSIVFLLLAVCALKTIIRVDASPTLNSVSAPKPQDMTGKLEGSAQGNQVQSAHLTRGTNVKQARTNTADKLKRGLTNFMNNLNPAPYFVPTQLASTGAKTATGSQAEPATIINDGPSADVLIKGPNRLVQARPLGGPLRWGRR